MAGGPFTFSFVNVSGVCKLSHGRVNLNKIRIKHTRLLYRYRAAVEDGVKNSILFRSSDSVRRPTLRLFKNGCITFTGAVSQGQGSQAADRLAASLNDRASDRVTVEETTVHMALGMYRVDPGFYDWDSVRLALANGRVCDDAGSKITFFPDGQVRIQSNGEACALRALRSYVIPLLFDECPRLRKAWGQPIVDEIDKRNAYVLMISGRHGVPGHVFYDTLFDENEVRRAALRLAFDSACGM